MTLLGNGFLRSKDIIIQWPFVGAASLNTITLIILFPLKSILSNHKPNYSENPMTLATGLARHFSASQLHKLQTAAVGIIGAGGLGSNVAFMLVRSGVRQLAFFDHDHVEPSNLNRQAFMPGDIGAPKVVALASHLRQLEPDLSLFCQPIMLTKENAPRLLDNYPIVVEAVDDATTKAMLYELFSASKALYVTASGMGGLGRKETPMTTRHLRGNVVAVGDFVTQADADNPPLAPRVMQAAAMQANAVLTHILS